MIDYAALITKSAMLRKRLGEDSYSPIDIFALAQSIDRLTLVYYPLGEKLSGMCVKGRSGNGLISINSSMTLGRQRFSLAHEFFHLFYDDNMVALCAKRIERGSDIERSADAFASYFLMPDATLLDLSERLASSREGRQLELGDVIRIEQYFGVSHQAAVYRLMSTQYLGPDRGQAFLSRPIRKVAMSMGYSVDLYMASPEKRLYATYGDYIRKAERALAKDVISYGKYEELLLDAFRADLVYGGDEEGDVID